MKRRYKLGITIAVTLLVISLQYFVFYPNQYRLALLYVGLHPGILEFSFWDALLMGGDISVHYMTINYPQLTYIFLIISFMFVGLVLSI